MEGLGQHSSVEGRPRLDSMHGLLNETRDYKRLKTADQRWVKIDKTLQKPATQLVLIEVPRGFDINQLNGKVDLKKRLQKAEAKAGRDQARFTSAANESYNVGIETQKASEDTSRSFSGAAHLTQLLTLIPNTEDQSQKSNLKVGKGISAYVKVTRNLLNEDNSKPQARHIVRTIPRLQRDSASTDVSARWETSSNEEDKKKHKKKNK